ncbi:MAG: hypothetical protein Q8L55_07045, partial [Phycisphaerales bacterium]|nr:hypothetical protein [Phycisphaerales bacterium]
PAALQHQTRMAQAVASAEAAGVDADKQRNALESFVAQVTLTTNAISALAEALDHHDSDYYKHARQVRTDVRGAMAALRAAVDALELTVSDDLWPVPTYGDLLFIK